MPGVNDPPQCHFCGYTDPDLAEVWKHQAKVHPVEDAEEIAELEKTVSHYFPSRKEEGRGGDQ